MDFCCYPYLFDIPTLQQVLIIIFVVICKTILTVMITKNKFLEFLDYLKIQLQNQITE